MEPFWKPMADDRYRYKEALRAILELTCEEDVKRIARHALTDPAMARLVKKLKRPKPTT